MSSGRRATALPLQVQSLPATPALLRGRAWREASGDDSPGRWRKFSLAFSGESSHVFAAKKTDFGVKCVPWFFWNSDFLGPKWFPGFGCFWGNHSKTKNGTRESCKMSWFLEPSYYWRGGFSATTFGWETYCSLEFHTTREFGIGVPYPTLEIYYWKMFYLKRCNWCNQRTNWITLLYIYTYIIIYIHIYI